MLTSRKLAGSIAAMLAVVGMLLGAVALGVDAALTADVSIWGVSGPVVFWAVVAVAGLGGFHVLRQARIDERNGADTDRSLSLVPGGRKLEVDEVGQTVTRLMQDYGLTEDHAVELAHLIRYS